MKYSIKYYKGCPILDKADEIIIKYDEKDPEIINFVQNWKKEQRIVLDIRNLSNEDIVDNLQIFKACSQIHNVAFLLSQNQHYIELAEINLHFFFGESVNSLDELVYQTNLGVSDIYIYGELCFSLIDIHEAYGEGVNIRVKPNIAQSVSTSYLDSFKKFFIRPEEVEIYEGIVDIFEFAGPITSQPVLYKIYQDRKWLGDLSILILGLKKHINSMNILPMFGPSRLNCKKRCAFDKCHICDHILEAAKILKDEGIVVTKEKRVYGFRPGEESVQDESARTINSVD